jgi:2-polyprenyl-6-methoxyphenol hydroxylase-like FAD-dependent oxidoreductase
LLQYIILQENQMSNNETISNGFTNRVSPAPTLKIGIIGGSIAGCTAAIELSRTGHHVTVFERSPGELKDRGAGMAAPVDTINTLIARDLVDANMPRFHIDEIPHVGRSPADETYGHIAWRVPVTLKPFNWGDLYRNLRRRVPESIYQPGCKVIGVDNSTKQSATIQFADGSQETFDLVTCADGYRSLGRRTLFPEVEMDYRGYVLWRCVLKEDQLPTSEPVENNIVRLSYDEGHAGRGRAALVQDPAHLSMRY